MKKFKEKLSLTFFSRSQEKLPFFLEPSEHVALNWDHATHNEPYGTLGTIKHS